METIKGFCHKTEKGLCEECLTFQPMSRKDAEQAHEGGTIVEVEGNYSNGFKEVSTSQQS